MKITIASGKGGTGKTMVATSLAFSLAALTPEQPPLFLDCDVEAPNAHLFLHPTLTEQQEVGLLIPSVDEAKCTHCGKCAEVCQYHAIAVLGQKTLVFPQLCHGCGSCTALCPEKAITEIPDRMGVIERGPAAAGISFARGVLDVGEPMAVPVIRQLKKWAMPSAWSGGHPRCASRNFLPGRRNRARQRLLAAGDRTDALWPARFTPGGPGGCRVRHPCGRDHQPGE